MNDRPVKRVGSSNGRARKKSITSDRGGESAWQFVNLSEMQHAKDPELRKLVRVNAMRHYRRSQPKRRDGSPHRPNSATSSHCRTMMSDVSPCTALELCEEDRDDESYLHDESLSWPSQWDQLLKEAQRMCDLSPPRTISGAIQQPAPDNGEDPPSDSYSKPMVVSPTQAPRRSSLLLLGSGNSDPFDSFPMKDNPQSSELLYHFSNVMARNCLPIDRGATSDNNPIRTVFIPMAMSDRVFFQATTTYAAVHLDMLHQSQNQTKTLTNKAQTISMIKERLRSTEDALSNSTIGAISMLAAVERTHGNRKEMQIHESAIGQMVRMRGGLNLLGCEVLQMFLSWGDLVTSTMLAVRPQFDLSTRCTNFIDSSIWANMPTLDITEERREFRDPLSFIYEQLRYLTAQVPQAGHQATYFSDIDMLAFSEARSLIEHSLLSLAPTSNNPSTDTIDGCSNNKSSEDTDYIFEAHRLAALIYLNIVLRNCSPNGGALQSLKLQLINTIKKAERPQPCLGERRRTAVWVCFMGGFLSLDISEERWFAERIRRAMRNAGAQSWAEVEEALREVVWVGTLKTQAWISLWRTVQDLDNSRLDAWYAGEARFTEVVT